MWLLIILGVLAAAAVAWHTYFRREPHGRGRAVLAVLRALALALIVLLLIDPHFNAQPSSSRNATRVILDSSLSMHMGRDAWSRAQTEAQQAARGTSVIPAGSDADSRVLPALQTAAEAGARRVVLITDGAIDDAAEVARWLPSLGLKVDVRDVGGNAVANRAISDVEAPAWAEAGKPLQLRVTIAATAMTGNAAIVVKQNGANVARAQVDLPSSGVAATELSFNASGPAQGGLVRYDVAFENADSIPDDDVRSVYVFISDKPAGVAIVSFDPDWEPRFLHPVLADALGLPVRTFLRVPAGMYFRGGNGAEAGGRVDESVVRRAVSEADLLVLHGFTTTTPDWVKQAAQSARHTIVFPGETGIQTPIATSSAIDGDWYVSPDLPASPITALLAGMDITDLPPLTSLQNARVDEGVWAPLLGGRTPRGGNAPLVVAGAAAGRRWAVALGTGYWRWAFRGGATRDSYARLWGALAGWIVQNDAQVASAAIRPVQRSLPRGVALQWVAPGVAADSLVLTLSDAAGRATRSTLQLDQDTATSRAPAPGHYSYDIRAFTGGKEVAAARGPLTVESYSPEFIRRRADLSVFKSSASALQAPERGAGRPLHSYSWLYALLVVLIAAEWILRRRWGLR